MILGIDQSLTGTAVCRLGPDGRVEHLLTVDPGHRRDASRLSYIKSVVAPYLPGAEFAAIEGYSYGSVGKVFELGEIGGVLRLLLFEHGIPFVQVAPASLKKYATGSGSADKAAMIVTARREGIAPADDNQADAFFLASIARNLYVGLFPQDRARLEVLKKLRNPAPKKSPRRIRKMFKTTL